MIYKEPFLKVYGNMAGIYYGCKTLKQDQPQYDIAVLHYPQYDIAVLD